jgi:hypothetical protein
LDAKGEVQEKVYDVVWGDADKRKPGKDGKLPPVGNTVDVENALWTNTIGDPELIMVWKDPDFNAGLRAFYYARVIEIPTPRWTAYDAKRFGVKPLPGTPMMLQERTYTSPIWYQPYRLWEAVARKHLPDGHVRLTQAVRRILNSPICRWEQPERDRQWTGDSGPVALARQLSLAATAART